MKPTKKQKDFVKECGQIACDILLLNSYGRTWDWIEKDELKDSCNTMASISTDNRYKELTINIYPHFWNHTESQQFQTIFHEFCHAITEHQYLLGVHFKNEKMVTVRELEDTREHETALVEKAFVWLFNDTEKYQKVSKFISKLKRIKTFKPKNE